MTLLLFLPVWAICAICVFEFALNYDSYCFIYGNAISFIDCLYLVFCKSTACEKLNQDLQVDFDSFANELNFFFLL